MIELMKELWPICRSLTGEGVRQTLRILQRDIPNLVIHEVPSGTKCFDWIVPEEWNIKDAYIIDPDGLKIVDFHKSNLHVVGYSVNVNQELNLEELQKHLYSIPESPEAIPYVTSYYKKTWGFCLTHKQREKLKDGLYKVVIDSEHKNGSLTYGEVLIPGKSEKEIFLSTYVCHPSMANNELSGPVVTTELVKWINQNTDHHYSYRIVFIPETIGSILYLSKNLEIMKKNIIAGYNITCVGDNRAYSFLPSRKEDSLSDQVAQHVLSNIDANFKRYSFLDRGSDERQYCSPGVDLPVASIMRSKYNEFPEYHTSLDNFDLVNEEGLQGAFSALKRCIEIIESNRYLKVTVLCEPQLGKRGMYPLSSTKDTKKIVQDMMNLLAYCDGEKSLLEIAIFINVPFEKLHEIAKSLEECGLLKVINKTE